MDMSDEIPGNQPAVNRFSYWPISVVFGINRSDPVVGSRYIGFLGQGKARSLNRTRAPDSKMAIISLPVVG